MDRKVWLLVQRLDAHNEFLNVYDLVNTNSLVNERSDYKIGKVVSLRHKNGRGVRGLILRVSDNKQNLKEVKRVLDDASIQEGLAQRAQQAQEAREAMHGNPNPAQPLPGPSGLHALRHHVPQASTSANRTGEQSLRPNLTRSLPGPSGPNTLQYHLLQARIRASYADEEWLRRHQADPLAGPSGLQALQHHEPQASTSPSYADEQRFNQNPTQSLPGSSGSNVPHYHVLEASTSASYDEEQWLNQCQAEPLPGSSELQALHYVPEASTSASYTDEQLQWLSQGQAEPPPGPSGLQALHHVLEASTSASYDDEQWLNQLQIEPLPGLSEGQALHHVPEASTSASYTDEQCFGPNQTEPVPGPRGLQDVHHHVPQGSISDSYTVAQCFGPNQTEPLQGSSGLEALHIPMPQASTGASYTDEQCFGPIETEALPGLRGSEVVHHHVPQASTSSSTTDEQCFGPSETELLSDLCEDEASHHHVPKTRRAGYVSKKTDFENNPSNFQRGTATSGHDNTVSSNCRSTGSTDSLPERVTGPVNTNTYMDDQETLTDPTSITNILDRLKTLEIKEKDLCSQLQNVYSLLIEIRIDSKLNSRSMISTNDVRDVSVTQRKRNAKGLPVRAPAETTTINVGVLVDENVDEIMVSLGRGHVVVPAQLMAEIDWSNYSAATRTLLQAVFTRKVLATSSLTGKQSTAFRHKRLKKRLDPRIINDIVHTVTTRCHVTQQEVRSCISHRCTSEERLYRVRRQYRRLERGLDPNVSPTTSSSNESNE